tara:strand:+ start:276 stop:1826 length:1551 start_codon:yes stop_codon:yes gene_type:complete
MRLFLPILLLSCLIPAGHVSADEKSSTSETTLFSFDDHSIPWRDNLNLTMVRPEKHAKNPVVPRGDEGACDEWAVQFYGSVLKHDGKYKAWYIAADNQSLELIKKGQGFAGLRPAYAESIDGVNWTKPNLGLVEHNGSKNNNLVKMNPAETAGIHLIVIHEEDEPDPSRQFKMMLTVSAFVNKAKQSSSVTLFSADGLDWHSPTPLHFEGGYLIEEDLILPTINFEQGGLFKMNGMYYLPGQMFSPSVRQPDGKAVGRAMVTLRSRDLIHWEECGALGFIRGTAIGIEGDVGADEEAHLASSIWNRGNVQLGVYGLWHGAKKPEDRGLDLGFMFSNNGIHFQEPERDYVFIPIGETGAWDEGGLLQGQGFENIGERTFIYYGSWDLTKPSYPPRGGIGIVSLRRDGFGYLAHHDTEKPARFETTLVKPPSTTSTLFINVEQLGETGLQVELLDGLNRPIPNYSGEQSAVLSQDGLHEEIIWPATNSAQIDIKEPYSVRVNFPAKGTARVYAIYVGE